jgi:hypothetical protein
VPAPPPDRARWCAGAIGASSPCGPSRSTDPTQTSLRPRTWQSGGRGGRAAPRLGRNGVPAPPPDRARWYAGAIGASSPHGPSRSTDPTQTSVSLRPRTWQSGGRGGRAAPRLGRNGVPAPPPDRGRWYAGAIGASSPHGPSRGCRLPCKPTGNRNPAASKKQLRSE